jgi:hypothetical protein
MSRRLMLLCALIATGCTAPHSQSRIGETVSLGKGEFYVSTVEARGAGQEVELLVHFRWTGPTNDLFGRFAGPKMKMTLTDSKGNNYSPYRPSGCPMRPPIPEDAVWVMRDLEMYQQSKGQDRSLESRAERDSARMDQLEADMKAGRNPIRWVQFFKVPSDRGGFSFIVENPDRQSGQPGEIEVSLGR